MFDDPWILYGAVPAAVSFAATGLLRLVAGPALGPRIAGSGAAIGLLAAFGIVVGTADLVLDRRGVVLAAAAALGIVVDLVFADLRAVRRTLIIVAPLLALVWLHGSVLTGEAGILQAILFGVTFVALAVIAFAFSDFEGTEPTPAILLAMAGLGLGLVLLFAGLRPSAGLALSAAAAIGGFLLWNWPVPRFNAGAGLTIGVMTPLLTLAATEFLAGAANQIAIALLVLIFFADRVFRLPATGGTAGRALRPLLLASVSGLIVLAAVAVATLTAL